MSNSDVVSKPRPHPGPSREYRFPEFETTSLSNGVRLVVAPVHKLPLVTVLALVDAGAGCDALGEEGLSQLVARALAEGSRRSDTTQLAERFERLGGALESGIDWDGAEASVTVTSDRVAAAVELLGEVLMEPALPGREIERLKAERLAELLQQQTEPRGLADDMFARFVYSSTSRFALPEGGTRDSVRSISRSRVADFHARAFSPRSLVLVFVGDIVTARAAEIAQTVFGTWQRAEDAPAGRTNAPRSSGGSISIVAKNDAPQSELRIGHVGLPRKHPDYFAVTVMNAVLGGLFSSRINLNLREVHAYTYGAFSAFDWRRDAGPFCVSTAVRSDVTNAATREVLSEIARMRGEPITDDELSLATSYLDGVFPIRYETTAAIAGALRNLVVFGHPADYFDRYRERIRAVTIQDVQRAAEAHLHPNAMQIVVVGDPALVRAPLEELNVGPVSVFDAEGSPL
jgi:zinc protease